MYIIKSRDAFPSSALDIHISATNPNLINRTSLLVHFIGLQDAPLNPLG